MTALEQPLITSTKTNTTSTSQNTNTNLSSSKNLKSVQTSALHNNTNSTLFISRVVDKNNISFSKTSTATPITLTPLIPATNQAAAKSSQLIEIKENCQVILSPSSSLSATTPPHSPALGNQLTVSSATESSNQMINEKKIENSTADNVIIKEDINNTSNNTSAIAAKTNQTNEMCVKNSTLIVNEDISIDINSNLIDNVNNSKLMVDLSQPNTKTNNNGEQLQLFETIQTETDIQIKTNANKNETSNHSNKLTNDNIKNNQIDSVLISSQQANLSVLDEREGEEEDMPLMSIIHTPPQSASSAVSLLTENPFVSIGSTVPQLQTINIVAEEPKTFSRNNFKTFKAQLKTKQERLKESLKDSYQRLRLNHTKFLQSHTQQQLNKALDRKKQLNNEKSIDLLNSVLISNLSSTSNSLNNSSNNENIKSLIDDIKFELQKQSEDKLNKRANYLKELNLNTKCNNKQSYMKVSLDELDGNDTDKTDSDPENDDENLKLNDNNYIETFKPCAATQGADSYWSMRRIQLGSEWQRVQLKLKMIEQKNEQCNHYINAHNSLIKNSNEKIAKSNRIVKNVSTSITVNTEQDTLPSEKEAAIAALSTKLQECVATIKPSITNNQTNSNSRCSSIRETSLKSSKLFNLSKSDMITFDDDLLKSLNCALVYFKTNLFKTACLCDRVPSKRKFNNKRQSMGNLESNIFAKTAKTCIFCHVFKTTYDKPRKTSLTSEIEEATSSPSTNQDEENNLNPKMYLETILVEHSYCKMPKAHNIKSVPAKKDSVSKKPNNKLVDFDDGLLLDKVVNERLNRLFDSSLKKPYKTLFDDDFELDLKQDHQCIIEAGFDLNSNEVKKLPNLSYEELKFLSDGLDSNLSSSNEIDYDDKQQQSPNIIEIEYDGNPNDLIVNFEEFENDSTRYQMVIGNNNKNTLTQQENLSSLNINTDFQTNLKCNNNNNINRKMSTYRNKYVQHKRARLSSSNQNESLVLTERVFEATHVQNEQPLKKRESKSDALKRLHNHRISPSIYNFNVFKQFRYLKSPTKKKRGSSLTTIKQSLIKKKTIKSTSSIESTTKKTKPFQNNSNSTKKSKRIRSSSSCSSTNSSLVSNNDLNDTIQATQSSTVATTSHVHKYNYRYNFNQSNKFDINNIVIPYDMMNNCKVVDIVKVQNVNTPKWRLVNPNESESITNEENYENEPLDNETFLKRHELYELKERYATLFKKLEKEKKEKLKLQQQSTNGNLNGTSNDPLQTSTSRFNKNLESLCLEEFKQLVAKLENERDKRLTQTNCQLSTSMPASLLSMHLSNSIPKVAYSKMHKNTIGRDENNNICESDLSINHSANQSKQQNLPTNENLNSLLSTSMPSPTLTQLFKKASALSLSYNNTNLNHSNTNSEYWPKRKFPLSDKEYDDMFKTDHQYQQTTSHNKLIHTTTNNNNNNCNNKHYSQHTITNNTDSSTTNNNNINNSDQIDVLMQIES